MAKVERQFMRIQHPLEPGAEEYTAELCATLEWKGFMRHEVQVLGSCEYIEWRKTLDYNREERRAAKRAGQQLAPNVFKGILPTGWQVLDPSDPRLSDPPALPAPGGSAPENGSATRAVEYRPHTQA